MGHLAVLHQLITGNSRGLPMSLFALMALLGTGLGPVTMAWVEANPLDPIQYDSFIFSALVLC